MNKQENKRENSIIKERILQYLDFKGVSHYSFYKDSGITRGVLTQSNGLSEENLHKFLAYAQDISTNWVLFGNGSMFSPNEKETPIIIELQKPQNNIQKPQLETPIIETEVGVDYIKKTHREFGQGFNEDYKGIPLLPLKAAAGVLSGYVDQMTKYDCDYYLVPEFKDADFLIKINGDSMQPRYLSGDIVACRTLPMDTFFQWNATYAINSEQGILIKRIKKANEDDSITLVSDNKDYEPFDLRKSQIHGLGKVIGLIRLDD